MGKELFTIMANEAANDPRQGTAEGTEEAEHLRAAAKLAFKVADANEDDQLDKAEFDEFMSQLDLKFAEVSNPFNQVSDGDEEDEDGEDEDEEDGEEEGEEDGEEDEDEDDAAVAQEKED